MDNPFAAHTAVNAILVVSEMPPFSIPLKY